jgi:hypothetical protein
LIVVEPDIALFCVAPPPIRQNTRSTLESPPLPTVKVARGRPSGSSHQPNSYGAPISTDGDGGREVLISK